MMIHQKEEWSHHGWYLWKRVEKERRRLEEENRKLQELFKSYIIDLMRAQKDKTIVG